MKKIIYIFLALAVLGAAFSCKKSNTISGHPDVITVYGTGYYGDIDTRFDTLALAMLSFVGYDTVITAIPGSEPVEYDTAVMERYDSTLLKGGTHKYFRGFQMLISSKYAQNGGCIITDVDCPVYIIAPASPIPTGWIEVANSTDPDNGLYVEVDGNRIDLKIFSTRAYAGKPVTIPQLHKAFCPTPMARQLTYEDRDL